MGNVPWDPQGGIVPGSNLKWTCGEWKKEVVELEKAQGERLGNERQGLGRQHVLGEEVRWGKNRLVCVGVWMRQSRCPRTTESLMYTHTHTHTFLSSYILPSLLQLTSCPHSPSSSFDFIHFHALTVPLFSLLSPCSTTCTPTPTNTHFPSPTITIDHSLLCEFRSRGFEFTS